MEKKDIFEQAVHVANDDDSIEEKRQRVLGKYESMFRTESIDSLDTNKFLRFFNSKENEHWSGLTQNITQVVADPYKLKMALTELLDESKPIEDRIDKVTGENGVSMVKGLKLARISAILQVAYPDRYGVFNTVSMDGLTEIGMNPSKLDPSWKSKTLGNQFKEVNEVLVGLSKDYGITLWALDWVWYNILHQDDSDSLESDRKEKSVGMSSGPEVVSPEGRNGNSAFSFESHLEDFLVENWDSTVLKNDLHLEILTDENTGQVIGQQYSTRGRNRIDLLCKNKDTEGFTIIELKRDMSTDEVVGQIQRYMGWVKHNLAGGKPVNGIVICHEANEDLRDALAVAQNLRCLTYTVSFQLSSLPGGPSSFPID